ncbi:DUF1574 domain-containing protein [Candidatus Bathyarchaeota archaeon]|nr:DUF1574 domain-containing protein [Candidatus Bathyarchaeota archaeon]
MIRLKKKGHGRNKRNTVKALLFIGCLFLAGEIILRAINQLNYFEPHEYGNRNEIAIKFNKCYSLFRNNEHKKKILFVGTSRAETNLDPFLLDELFGQETITYNLGVLSSGGRVHEYLLKYLINTYLKPDLIIYDLHPHAFLKRRLDVEFKDDYIDNDYNILHQVAARIHRKDYANMNRQERVRLKLVTHSFIIKYLTRAINRYPYFEVHERGFLNLKGNKWNEEFTCFTEIVHNESNLSNATDVLLQNITSLMNTSDFLILYGPFGHEFHQAEIIDNFLDSLNHDDYLDFNGDTNFTDCNLYNDKDHFNYNGSKIMTEIVHGHLKSIGF